MLNWASCRHVIRREGYLSGEPALVLDPRIAPELVVENMDDGMTAQEVKDAYDLTTPAADLQEIHEYAFQRTAGAA